MHRSPVFCEQCVKAGKNTPADYVYQSEEISLAGPLLGDPDAWPPHVGGRRSLWVGHCHWRYLFREHSLRSVTANTRRDGRELLKLAAEILLHTQTTEFLLEQANEASCHSRRAARRRPKWWPPQSSRV